MTDEVPCFLTDILADMVDPALLEFPLDDPPPYREYSSSNHEAVKGGDTDSTKSTDGEANETTPLNNTFRQANLSYFLCTVNQEILA